MPLNPDAVGSTSEPVEVSWTSKDALLYAVGIGAGHEELAFTTENTNGVDQLVFPTFPVVIGWGRGSAMGNIGTFNPALLVHGQQAVTLASTDPGRGHGVDHERARRHVRQGQGGGGRHRVACGDGRRAALHQHVVSVHPWRRRLGRRSRAVGPEERAARTRSGSRGVVSDIDRPGVRVPPVRRPQPAAHRSRRSRRSAASTARSCTGCAATASPVVRCSHAVCGSDPARFQHIEARFAAPVLPGDTLTITHVVGRRRRDALHDLVRSTRPIRRPTAS